MKKGVVFLIISLLLINVNFVSSLGDLESSDCVDIYTMSYILDGGGEYEILCSDVAENNANEADFCKNEVTIQHILQQGDQRGYAFRDYVDEEGDDFDYNVYYQYDDIAEFSTLNPCNKCGTYFEGLDPSCRGYLIGETRHCQGYPMVGRCRAATEEYLGTEYIFNNYGYNRLFADDAADLLWGECTYEWDLNTGEICGNGLDDDCDGRTDEGCVGACLGSQEFCTNNEDGCCPGLTCVGDLSKFCLTCRNEGETCWNDGDCCNRPCDGTNDQGDSVCGCPDGFVWNNELQICEFARASCFDPDDPDNQCSIDPRVNFAAWLGDSGCFMNFLGIRGNSGGNAPYEFACCPYNPGEDYDEVWSFDNIPDSMIVVS